jgi:hypothetical protein
VEAVAVNAYIRYGHLSFPEIVADLTGEIGLATRLRLAPSELAIMRHSRVYRTRENETVYLLDGSNQSVRRICSLCFERLDCLLFDKARQWSSAVPRIYSNSRSEDYESVQVWDDLFHLHLSVDYAFLNAAGRVFVERHWS